MEKSQVKSKWGRLPWTSHRRGPIHHEITMERAHQYDDTRGISLIGGFSVTWCDFRWLVLWWENLLWFSLVSSKESTFFTPSRFLSFSVTLTCELLPKLQPKVKLKLSEFVKKNQNQYTKSDPCQFWSRARYLSLAAAPYDIESLTERTEKILLCEKISLLFYFINQFHNRLCSYHPMTSCATSS